MTVMCIGLENPQGTVDQFGKSAAGSLTEVDLVAAVTVPTGDQHHLFDFCLSVANGATLTIFRLYYRTSSAGSWVQINEFEVSTYGVLGVTISVPHKIKAGEQWKVTGQQSTIGRMSARVGGQAKSSDSRTAA